MKLLMADTFNKATLSVRASAKNIFIIELNLLHMPHMKH